MATLSELHAAIDDATAALRAGAFSDAVTHCDVAMLILAAIPDSMFDNGDQLRFDRQGATMAITNVRRACNQRRVTSIVNTQDIRYRRG